MIDQLALLSCIKCNITINYILLFRLILYNRDI